MNMAETLIFSNFHQLMKDCVMIVILFVECGKIFHSYNA